MPLMGSLYIGKTGLSASQEALNTTAHNLTNLDTNGYTRQSALFTDSVYNKVSYNASGVSDQQIGLGVVYAKTRQLRNEFFDATYRRESGRSMFYQASYDTICEVDNILGELYGSSFSESLNKLYTALSELSKTPNDAVVEGLVVQRACSFLADAQNVYKGLSDYQDNLNLQIKKNVDRINDLGRQIDELNYAIRSIEAAGVESANDLRDKRNYCIDELSKLARISYHDDVYGNTLVDIEGHDFVVRGAVRTIGCYADEETGFFTPFWEMDASYTRDANGNKIYNIEGAEVFDMTQTISMDINTDIGELKAMLFARGDHRADYTDLLDEKTYNRDIAQSVLMNVQAEFDQLVHAVATEVNAVLAEHADTRTGYLCESVEVGGMVTYRPIQLFQKRTTDGYEYVDADDEGVVDGRNDWRYMKEDPDNPGTLYSVNNLVVNADLIKQPTILNFIRPDESTDYTTAEALAAVFEKVNWALNPNVAPNKQNLKDYYSALVIQVSNSGSVFRSIYEAQETTVSAADSAREQVMGVSSNEELTSMIKYQNAYNAASRYITVVDQMLEHLLNRLG